MAGENEVNPHYLEHVIATGLTREVEVSEDIYAHNGMKLLAKGARVNGDTRDRLLEHKLLKPLEDCLEITGGVTACCMTSASCTSIRSTCSAARAWSPPSGATWPRTPSSPIAC